MPKYKITDPETGESKIIMGETPPTQEDIGEIFASAKIPTPTSKEPQPQGKSLGGFFANVGENVGEIAKGVATAVTHPVQTAKAVGQLALNIPLGAAEKLAGVPPGSEAQRTLEMVSKPFVKAYKEPTKIPGMIFDYLYEKPIDAALLASGGLSIAGKGAKVAGLTKTAETLGKVARITDPLVLPEKAIKKGIGVAKTIGKEIEGTLTGGGAGFIEEAAKGSPAFQKAMRGKITGEEVVTHAKDALQKLRDDRGQEYLIKLRRVRTNPVQLQQVKTALDAELKRLMAPDEFRINFGFGRKGRAVVDFSDSPLVKNRNIVEKAITDVMTWNDTSAAGLDILKKRLSTYIGQVEHQSPAEAFLTKLERNLNGGLKNAIPEYERMTRGYAEATNLIKDIESNLMLRKEGITGRITADQTLRRLTSALRENFEMRKDLLNTLGSKSGMEIPAEVAGYVARQWIPRGGLGKIFAAGEIAILMKAINPKFWPIILASSPRVAGEFLNTYGKIRNKLKPILGPVGARAKILRRPEILAPVGLAGRIPSSEFIEETPKGPGMYENNWSKYEE